MISTTTRLILIIIISLVVCCCHFPFLFVHCQYYDYQTRGVNSVDCPEDQFQLRALECECSLVLPTPSPYAQQQQQQQQRTEDDDPYQQQQQQQNEGGDDDYYYTTKRPAITTSNPLNPQRVILGCLNIDGNRLAQLLRRIAGANYAIASLTLENAQLRGTRWLPANVQLDDELTIRNSTLGDQSLDELSNLVGRGENAQLQRLTLNHVGLTRIPRLQAAQTERLSMLNVEDNQIETLGADDLRQMPSLQALHLSRNRIRDIDADAFSQNPLLANLQLDGNQLDSLPSGLFRSNTQLGQLSLRANQFKSLPDNVFEGLEGGLYHLNLAENQLESLPPAVMTRLEKLEGLNVGSNRIRDNFRLSPELSHLRTLEVSNNSMSSLPEGLEHMTKLEQLVSNNNYIRIIPKLPPALKNLQYVSLYQSGVEHVCPEAFRNVPSVQHIHLDGHNLTTIPHSAFAGVTPLAVSLGSNRATLICDCRLAWLRDWVDNGVLQYPDYVICAGPAGSEMENQPLNRIGTTMSCPYVSESDLDVPPECHNTNNNKNNDDYYPGSNRARYNNDDRDRQLQDQLNRAQPNLWPSYVHSDRQADNNNNDDTAATGDQAYHAHGDEYGRTRDSDRNPPYDNTNNEQQQQQHRPTINGYGHSQASTDATDDDEASREHRHQHGPGITVDPNDITGEDGGRRAGEQMAGQEARDEEGHVMHHAGSAAGHGGERHQQEIAANGDGMVTADPDDNDDNDSSTNATGSSSMSDGLHSAAPSSAWSTVHSPSKRSVFVLFSLVGGAVFSTKYFG